MSAKRRRSEDDDSMALNNMSTKRLRSEDDDSLALELSSFFECPVCFNTMTQAIAQCQNGHLLCFSCRGKVSQCPTCRGPISDVRARAMEQMAEKISQRCKYSAEGCTARPALRDKQYHEEICEFRPCPCIYPQTGCQWTGPLNDMRAHVFVSHSDLPVLRGEKVRFVVADLNTSCRHWRAMQSCFNQNFVLVLQKWVIGNHELYTLLVQLIGTKKMTNKYTYHLDVRGNNRQLTWKARPVCIFDDAEEALRSKDCLMFNAMQFATGWKLSVDVTVGIAAEAVLGTLFHSTGETEVR